MNKTFKLAIAAAFGVLLFSAAPMAMAQDDIEGKVIPSVEYQQADVREALRALFKMVNVSYAIDPDVQGYINVSLKNVPFGTALQNILRQVDSVYQVQGGIYRIMRKAVDTTQVQGNENLGNTLNTGNTKVVRRIKIRSADPMFIAAMLGSTGGSQDFAGAPERSTMLKTGGAGGGGFGGGQGGGGFGGQGGGGFGGGQGGGGFGGGGGGGFGGGGFGGGGGGLGGGGGGRGGF